MAIPQSQINDLPTLTNLAASVDSSTDAINILQILDAVLDRGTGKKYYDSAGDFPQADSSNVGMIINENSPGYLDNTFNTYVSTGSKWNLFRQQIIPNAIPGYQGDVGYQIGSNATPANPAPAVAENATIWSWPTNADVPSTRQPHSTMLSHRTHISAAKGATHGYVIGGYYPFNSPNYGGPPYAENNIDSFPFAAAGAASTNVAQLTSVTIASSTSSDLQSGYAYSVGGTNQDPSLPTFPSVPALNNVVDAFPTVSVVPAVDTANLTVRVYHAAGMSSPTDGYSVSGGGSPIIFPQIGITAVQKFPFSGLNPVAVLNVATLPSSRYHYQSSGTNSTTDAYTMGGYGRNPSNFDAGGKSVTKFPFASETTITNLSDLSPLARVAGFGVSSPTHGYIVGGNPLPPAPTTGSSGKDKVAFVNDTVSSANIVGSPNTFSRFNAGTQSD